MSWITVKESLPKENIDVLLTIREVKSGKCYVSTGSWSSVIDLETGEIIGAPTFTYITNEEGRLIMCDYLKDKSIKVIAWMPYPQPCKDEFRVIIAGSRTFTDYAAVKEHLDKIFSKRKPTSIVCGETKGADMLGRRYAEEHKIKIDSYPADWQKYGKQAGYIRNEQMAANADALVAFHMNDSAGTKHMISTAKQCGLQVRVIKV